jgi:hypothetical protein
MKKETSKGTFDSNQQFGYSVGFDLIAEGKHYLEIVTDGDRHDFPHASPSVVGVARYGTELIARMIPRIERLQDALRDIDQTDPSCGGTMRRIANRAMEES